MLTLIGMTKHDAISIFGSVKDLASAYGCERQAIYQWPDVLPAGIADRVLGVATRTGKNISKFVPKKRGSETNKEAAA